MFGTVQNKVVDTERRYSPQLNVLSKTATINCRICYRIAPDANYCLLKLRMWKQSNF